MKYMTQAEFRNEMRKIQNQNKQIEMRQQLKEEKRKIHKGKGIKTTTKMLIISVTAIVLYTVACLFIQYKTSVEVSSTLSKLWYSFFTVEIVSLSGIKITKVIKGYKSSDTDTDTDFDTEIEEPIEEDITELSE